MEEGGKESGGDMTGQVENKPHAQFQMLLSSNKQLPHNITRSPRIFLPCSFERQAAIHLKNSATGQVSVL